MDRIAAFGHGAPEQASAEQALAYARECEPVLPALESVFPEGVSAGDHVTVTPADYGKIPVDGRLVACAPDEVVLERETPEAGLVMTHFPVVGFELVAIPPAPE